MTRELSAIATESSDRIMLWQSILCEFGVQTMAEVGVFRGQFAEAMLEACPSLTTYYMIDPWRHLDDWDKPANRSDDVFERFLQETLDRTEKHADKRVVLRGRTTEVIDKIPDESVDLIYVDGDHTLRGVTIDLLRSWVKVKPGGWLGGDDLTPSIFQHGDNHEPTFVFPWAMYFAEAVGSPITILPFRQFLIQKQSEMPFDVVNLSQRPYRHRTVRAQLAARQRALAATPAGKQ